MKFKTKQSDPGVQIWSRVSRELLEEVREVAENHETTVSEVVRVFITDGLQRLKSESPRRRGK